MDLNKFIRGGVGLECDECQSGRAWNCCDLNPIRLVAIPNNVPHMMSDYIIDMIRNWSSKDVKKLSGDLLMIEFLTLLELLCFSLLLCL